MRRSTILWISAAASLLIIAVATLISLNATVYSANGFARAYLDAVSERDAIGALAMPGVAPAAEVAPAAGEHELLESGAMGELGDIRLVSDRPSGQGKRAVIFEVQLGDSTERSSFVVERTAPVWGIFQGWRFAEPPLALLEVDVANADSFTANGTAAPAGEHWVFAPGEYTLDHSSRLLNAKAVTARAVVTGSRVVASITAEPTAAFERAVQSEVERLLDACASRSVLQAAGCPFGASVQNRLEGEPSWALESYPSIDLRPTRSPNEWLSRRASGSAVLEARVRSLFDGTVEEIRSDVPFEASYRVIVSGDFFTVELD